MNWQDVFNFLNNHWTQMGLGGGVLGIAAIHTMPKVRPRTLDEFYAWIRDAFQTAIPAGRAKEVSPDPTSQQPKQ